MSKQRIEHQVILFLIFLFSLISISHQFIYAISLLAIVLLSYRFHSLLFGLILIALSILTFIIMNIHMSIFMAPFIFLLFAIFLLAFILYKLFVPRILPATVVAYDVKTGYVVLRLDFDFISGIQAGDYAVKTKRKLKVGDRISVVVRFRLFSMPKISIR